MDRSQIERNLGFLGQKLAEMQIKATIILMGGALMVTQIGNRTSTQDIDVVIATNDRGTYQASSRPSPSDSLFTQKLKPGRS